MNSIKLMKIFLFGIFISINIFSSSQESSESASNDGKIHFYKNTYGDKVQVESNPLASGSSQTSAATFSYNPDSSFGPSKWGKFNPVCKNGNRQSPINLKTNKLVVLNNVSPLKLDRMENQPESIKIENTGHTAKYVFNYGSGKPPQLSGGPLQTSTYVMDHMHFHWNLSSGSGSEHAIDGRKFAAEMHIVTYNSKYPSLTDALSHSDGLAVLGYLFQYSSNMFYKNEFSQYLDRVRKAGTVYVIKNSKYLFSIKDIIKSISGDYLTYDGSLTIPNCNEVVTWFVFTKPLKIYKETLNQFRMLKNEEGEPMKLTSRPLQDFNNRVIKKSV